MAGFKPDQPVEQMLDLMNKSGGNTETIHAGPVFIQHKLQEQLLADQERRHKELLTEQNAYNTKQLFWTRVLALATICLAIATALLLKFH